MRHHRRRRALAIATRHQLTKSVERGGGDRQERSPADTTRARLGDDHGTSKANEHRDPAAQALTLTQIRARQQYDK